MDEETVIPDGAQRKGWPTHETPTTATKENIGKTHYGDCMCVMCVLDVQIQRTDVFNMNAANESVQ